jgi:hypothetical protein
MFDMVIDVLVMNFVFSSDGGSPKKRARLVTIVMDQALSDGLFRLKCDNLTLLELVHQFLLLIFGSRETLLKAVFLSHLLF